MVDLDKHLSSETEEAEALGLHLGATLLDLVPGIGPALARALEFKVGRRAAEAERRFRVDLVAAIKEMWEKLEDRPNIEDVFDSDRFVATFAACTRAAAETSSESKRARLAKAAASAVLPSSLEETEIETNLRFVERYSDIHVWLLAFYCDPATWLRGNGMAAAADDRIRGGRRDEPLNAALGSGAARMRVVRDAIEDLQRDMMLVTFDLSESVGERQQFTGQTRRRGRRLLAFIDQEATEMAAPGAAIARAR